LIFEARVGKGHLPVVGGDLKNNLQNRPVTRQLRHSVAKYVGIRNFDSQQQVNPKAIVKL